MARGAWSPVKVLVVGGGPAGKRHCRILRELGHDVAVARRRDQEVAALAAELDVAAYAGLDAADAWSPEAVIVANAPSEHLAAAAWAVDRRLPVLVEKPLAPRIAGVRALLEDARRAGVRVAVGHNLRFHPALRAVHDAVASGRIGALLTARLEVGGYLPEWHPEGDYRRSTAASAALGGGALLTLVHELDLALWIGGSASLVQGVRARVSSLEIDADDIAELVLRRSDGGFVSLHMDLLDRSYNRRSRWVGDAATAIWSWNGPAVLLSSGGETVIWDDGAFSFEETYVVELEAFLAGEDAPGRPLADAVDALEICEQVEWTE